MKSLIRKLKIYIQPFLNWRFLISFSIPWMIVNGWSWIGVYLIPIVGMNWYTSICLAWQAILWQPWTIEKLVTVPIAMWIHSKLFKNDKKTRDQLISMHSEAKEDWSKAKRKVRYPYLIVRIYGK